MIIRHDMTLRVPYQATAAAQWHFQNVGRERRTAFGKRVEKHDTGRSLFKNLNPLRFDLVHSSGGPSRRRDKERKSAAK